MALIEVKWSLSVRELRRFAAVLMPIFFGLVGGFVALGSGSWTWGAAVWGPAFLICVLGYAHPGFMQLVYAIWMHAVYPIGWCISHLMMALIFFGTLMPIGLVMKLFGRRVLHRRFDPDAETYWEPYRPDDHPERYFNQY